MTVLFSRLEPLAPPLTMGWPAGAFSAAVAVMAPLLVCVFNRLALLPLKAVPAAALMLLSAGLPAPSASTALPETVTAPVSSAPCTPIVMLVLAFTWPPLACTFDRRLVRPPVAVVESRAITLLATLARALVLAWLSLTVVAPLLPAPVPVSRLVATVALVLPADF
ncbi:hypothetical protein D3C72_1249750 [compost metagenome]